MKRPINQWFLFLPIGIFLLLSFVPYLWILLSSLKMKADLITTNPVWLFSPTMDNYLGIWEKGFQKYLINSMIVGSSSTVLCVFVGTLAAYAFSRYRVPAGNQIFFYIMATRLGPPVAYALPMYLVFRQLGIGQSYIGVILAHATFNLVLVVWMMKAFFDEVPKEVEEAAYLDGCSHFKVFWKIAVPMSFPGIVAVSIFALIFSWNEFIFALILTSGETRTLTVMIPTLALHSGTLWGEVAAASVIQSLPILVFIFFIQKQLVQGLTFGAVKG